MSSCPCCLLASPCSHGLQGCDRACLCQVLCAADASDVLRQGSPLQERCAARDVAAAEGKGPRRRRKRRRMFSLRNLLSLVALAAMLATLLLLYSRMTPHME